MNDQVESNKVAGTDIEVFNSDEDWRDQGYSLSTPPLYIVCYDPAGDGDDADALVVISREEWQRGIPEDINFSVQMKFRVLMCQRMPQDYEFPEKLARILALHKKLTNWTALGRITSHVICVETNGVGWGLASALRDKLGNVVIPYTTTGSSSSEPYSGKKTSMPRLAALDHLRILMETHHLKVIPDAPGVKLLTNEMNSFVWRRPGRPEAMHGQKDDLIMALTGGVWIGSKIIGPFLKAKKLRRA